MEVLNLPKGKRKEGGNEARGRANHDQKMGSTAGGIEHNIAGGQFQLAMAVHNGINDYLWHNLTF